MFDIDLLIKAAPSLIQGLGITFLVTAASFIIASAGGFLLGLASLSAKKGLARSASGFTQVARATPEIIAIFWAYYCLPILIGANLSGITCGVLALGLIGAGYMAEIVRGGVQAVAKGQWEAAKALALPTPIIWATVILPQAVKKMLPPTVNYLSDLIKATTLLAGVGVGETAYAAYMQGAATYRYLEPLTGVAILFFLMIFPISLLARRLDGDKTTT
ncbi:MAG TPA: amino acid ABC transporter permease [Nordella sp.]|nr:amino acid ABC transporter permease [Nordella sp.]